VGVGGGLGVWGFCCGGVVLSLRHGMQPSKRQRVVPDNWKTTIDEVKLRERKKIRHRTKNER